MIGGTLEYLMSSLPHLTFQHTEEARHQVIGLLEKYAGYLDKALSPVEILDGEARKFLPADAFAVFQKIHLNNIHEPEFQMDKSKVLSAYSTFTFQLKGDIKKWRTLPDESENKSIKNKVESIIGEGTPLEKEIQIMQHQWEKLNELSAGHFSDFEALVTYKIKLMLLLRWWSFNMEKGMEHYTNVTKKTAHGR